MGVRAVNLVLGIWLVLSAFLWEHGPAQFYNALAAGFLASAFALLASETLPRARYGNTVVGAWLLVSTLLLPGLAARTAWNHVLVGLLVLTLSLIPRLPPIERFSGRVRVPDSRRWSPTLTEPAVNAVLGTWLFLSGFLWEHSVRQFYNAWIVGACLVATALGLFAATFRGLWSARWGRLVNGLLGTALVAVTLLWPDMRALTFWNHVLVGLAVVLVALFPALRVARRHADVPGHVTS